jgi:DNA polymerase-1
LEPDQRHGMDALAQNYLGYTPISIETLIGAKGKNQRSMRDLPAAEVAEYAAEDADVTWRLHEAFTPKLAEAGLESVLHDLESPLVPVLADMERAGMCVDLEGLARYSVELGEDSARLEAEVRELAGKRPRRASTPRAKRCSKTSARPTRSSASCSNGGKSASSRAPTWTRSPSW